MEAVVAGGLVAAFMAGAPLAAVAAGHAAYSIGSRTAYAQQAAWRKVPTVLLATAPAAGYRQYQVTVQAGWTARTGRHFGGLQQRQVVFRVTGGDRIVRREAELIQGRKQPGTLGHPGRKDHRGAAVADYLAVQAETARLAKRARNWGP